MISAGHDVIVIGAGAAGLACARALTRTKLRVLCLEARDRIGGRIYTSGDDCIELGAEFVHGRPREIFSAAEEAGLEIVETEGRRIHAFAGTVSEGGEAGPVLDDLKRAPGTQPDETFQHFLDRLPYSQDEKQEAASFVEGFNAAFKDEVSVVSLAKDLLASDAIEGTRAFRIKGGYTALAAHLAKGIEIRLNSTVRHVAWNPHDCRVLLDGGDELRASRVVVTLPLSLLQANSVTFDPEPTAALDAARALRFGHAVRITFRFDRPFWEDDPRFQDTGFVISGEPVFPVWWSALPNRDPLLTAWSAGPKAVPLLGLAQSEIQERALASLRHILGRDPAPVIAAHFHDWQADPFSLGAYSWVPAGGLPARDTLARPIAETIYFSGEHTDLDGYGGTVHGAIASGQRAARQILEACR
jgi:monoamine oxidase